jgi:hypothetical protein
MPNHRRPSKARPRFPSLYFPAPRVILGCTDGRIFWVKTMHMTGWPSDEARDRHELSGF